LKNKLAADIKPGLVKRLKNLANEERYGGNARKLVDSVAKDRASRHTAMQFLEAADFTVKYGERALILYYNQVGFDSIAADLIRKYRFIKQCLKKKKRSAHVEAIISVFKYSQKGWRDFVRDCKNGKTDQSQDITGTWVLPGYKATIIGSGQTFTYTGEEIEPMKKASKRYKHKATISLQGSEYKGKITDVAGFCCNNSGTLSLKFVDNDTIMVESKWTNPPLFFGWKTLKREK